MDDFRNSYRDDDDDAAAQCQDDVTNELQRDETTSSPLSQDDSDSWRPSGNWLKDFLFFSGPGWFVSIAYVDPGNYQADIQAGGTS
eukprot:scaffold14504_cov111-Cylindrotheca_fusiformis.AAC.1